MVNLKMLYEAIDRSGMNLSDLSDRSGIDRKTLYGLLSGSDRFFASHIYGMIVALHLSSVEVDKIFFPEFKKEC